MTPSEFIQNRRINRAATLLQERPDLLVNEISDRLGFASTIYFSRCFKAEVRSIACPIQEERAVETR